MHRHIHHFHRFSVGIAAVLLSLSFGCASNGKVETKQADVTVSRPGTTGAVRQPWPENQPAEQSQWVRDRLNVQKQIFRFTPAGDDWIDGYDFRQMMNQPAWFGSYGYDSWAGAGEAVPRSVLHEISHSYWGAFSVAGQPDLSWSRETGVEVAEALLAYRKALEEFMLQPPDRYEPLRDRFRNLPGLSTGQYTDLAHFGEADLLYMTGGNLQLIPPILRPYFTGFLADGGVGPGDHTLRSWDESLAWFNELSGDDRRIAGEVFGLQHFPAEPYKGLPEADLGGLDPAIRSLYEAEERQRLVDFAEQFDGVLGQEFALLDAAGADRGFDFWRSYLSDKLALHQKHPGVLGELQSTRGAELAVALDFYGDVESASAEDQVRRYQAAKETPFVPELAVLLNPRAIVELFTDPQSADGVAGVLGSRADRLAILVAIVDRVAELHAVGDGYAAIKALETSIDGMPEEQFMADAFLLLDLLRGAGTGVAADVLPGLSNETLGYLLRVQPAFARSSEIGVDRLLRAVGVTDESSLDDIAQGMTLLTSNSSGNFAIDERYEAAAFSHLDRFADSSPADVLDVVFGSGVRPGSWIDRASDGAMVAIRAVPDVFGRKLANLYSVRETPWRLLHMIADRDPELAARIVMQMELVTEPDEETSRTVRMIEWSIREFAYDRYWFERNSGPNVDPSRFAEFLLALDSELSDGELEEILKRVFAAIDADTSAGLVEESARSELVRTLEAAIESQRGQDSERLRSLAVAAVGFS